jgi:hypothetical protein
MKHLRRAPSTGILVALLLLIGTAAAAQSDDEYDNIYPFLGNWDSQISMPDGQDRGSCGGLTDEFGVKLVNCSMPVDHLPLNARGQAWLKYVDIFQSPSTTECAGLSLPSALGSASNVSFSGSPGRVVINVSQFGERTVWMNGLGPMPKSGELFHHTGYSVGHFDGKDFVIETSHFTFDPDGMDDHVHMANSARMKFIERYQFNDDDTLRVVMTIDDPIFLTKPFTYSRLFMRAPARGQGGGGWSDCDPEASRREVEFNYPGGKYSEAPQR